MLKEGRNPKVQLKDLSGISVLRYYCIEQLDGAAGWCIIKQLPPEHKAIQTWLSKLPTAVEYCGEGLAGIT